MAKKLCFSLHGYKETTLDWFYESLNIFNSFQLPVKAVNYDVERNKVVTKKIEVFCNEMNGFDIESFFSFSIFHGRNIRQPATWEYGVYYDKPTRTMVVFFDENSERCSVEIVENIIRTYLLKNVVDFGYFYYGGTEYAMGSGRYSFDLYEEDNSAWWNIMNPRNRDVLFNLNGRIRHVYPLTLISEKLLYYKNESFYFYEWVQNGCNGKIEKFGKGNWLWELPQDRLYDIGKVLYEQKLLLGVKI